MTSKIPVLITAAGGGGVGEQILKALLIANQEHGLYYIIAGDVNPYAPQLKLADEAICLPMASDPDFIGILKSICKAKGCKALFYGCEPDLKKISAHRDAFEDAGVFVTLNPAHVIASCMDKVESSLMLKELGFNPPRYLVASGYDDVSSIDWFPVVIKPSQGSGGSAHCYIAQTADELQHLSRYLNSALPGQDFVVQEYVGNEDSEYTVGILHDMDGEYLNSIAMRRILKSQLNVRGRYKNLTGRSELGENLIISSGVSHGHIGKFPEVTDACKKIAATIGARGAINIQLRLCNDGIKVFEINPRFSGTTSLRAMMGYNEPDVLIRKHILGHDVQKDFPFKNGTIIRGLREDILDGNPALPWEGMVT